eukprot:g1835.t1
MDYRLLHEERPPLLRFAKLATGLIGGLVTLLGSYTGYERFAGRHHGNSIFARPERSLADMSLLAAASGGNMAHPPAPAKGMQQVMIKPAPPGLLLAAPTVPYPECIFLFPALKFDTAPNSAFDEPAWVYGAKVEEGKGPLPQPTGHAEDIVHGRLVCWELETALKVFNTVENTYRKHYPDKQIGIGEVQAVLRNGDSKRALWCYKPGGVKVTKPHPRKGGTAFSSVSMPFRIGLGLAALGRPGYINLNRDKEFAARDEQSMKSRTFEVLDAAWDMGVRWFDVARSYGLSEAFLGEWLKSRGRKPEELIVSSKWGYVYTANWKIDTGGKPHEVKDHTFMPLFNAIPQSKHFLGDHLDIYQIHSATFESGILDDRLTQHFMSEMGHKMDWTAGMTVSGVEQGAIIERGIALTSVSDFNKKFLGTVQATFNILETSAGPALLKAYENGVDIIIKEAMGNGRVLNNPIVMEEAANMKPHPD